MIKCLVRDDTLWENLLSQIDFILRVSNEETIESI